MITSFRRFLFEGPLIVLTFFNLIPAIVVAVLARLRTVPRAKTRILLAGLETSANLQQISLALAEDTRYSVSLARFGSHPFYSLGTEAFNDAGVHHLKTFETPNDTPKTNITRKLSNQFARIKGAFFIFWVFFKYDIVFFNSTRSFMALNLDYLLLRLAGRTVFVRHCGDDVRYRPLQDTLHRAFGVNQWRYGKSNFAGLWSKFFTQIWAERTAIVFSTRDHATFQTRRLVRRPYVQTPFPGTTGFRRKVPLIIHAPSNPEIKGTEAVRKTVEALHQDGIEFEFRILSGVPHHQVLAALSEAMIVVDQPGAVPARLAVEGMTAGCAVLGGDVPEIHMMGDIPIVRFEDDSDSLAEALRTLLLDRQMCQDLGDRARAYALVSFSRPAFRTYFEEVLNGEAKTFEPLAGRIPLMEAGADTLSEKIVVWLLKLIQKQARRSRK